MVLDFIQEQKLRYLKKDRKKLAYTRQIIQSEKIISDFFSSRIECNAGIVARCEELLIQAMFLLQKNNDAAQFNEV